MAVRAVASKEKEQHMVFAQCGDGLGPLGQLVPVEDFQRPGIDRATLLRGVQLWRGPGDVLGDIREVGSSGHHLGFQFHVAAHIGFGGPHDGDVAVGLDRLLEAFELHQFGRFAWQLRRSRYRWRGRNGGWLWG
jgi:hypothetical protein